MLACHSVEQDSIRMRRAGSHENVMILGISASRDHNVRDWIILARELTGYTLFDNNN